MHACTRPGGVAGLFPAVRKHHGDYRLSSVHSSSLPAQCCLDCSRVLYTPLLHCLCYRTTREHRRTRSSREESAERVPGSPQRHKRERNLRENHHIKRKNNRASQQRAVRSVNVCTEFNSSCTAASSLIQLSY